MGCCGGCGEGGRAGWVVFAVVAAAGCALLVVRNRSEEAAKTEGAVVLQPVITNVAHQDSAPKEEEDPAYVLGFTVKRIDGTLESLEAYKGKVLLFVNVASECGYTPQYEGLEKLYREKKDAGFVVLGFPANNFGGQEPGENKQIAEFCSTKFGVTFPMFEKISVAGQDQHELYRKFAAQPAPIGGDPKWNFTKFLVDRTGRVAARFEPKVKPDDAELLRRIDELLAQK